MLGGGTSNHLILADVFGSLGITGQEAETLLDRVGITLNKNTIADDTRKPLDPSGIRFGTPAITTRGFKEKECARVSELMIDALKNRSDEKKLISIREEIKQLCLKFPIPDSFV
jgi:glycine hydroxymethyltransferase